MPTQDNAGYDGAAAALPAACSRTEPPVTYELQPLVQGGSKFHGVHGLRFDKDDNLFAVSVIGQSLLQSRHEDRPARDGRGPSAGHGR